MSVLGHNQKKYRDFSSLTNEEKECIRKTIIELNDSMSRAYAEREFQKEAITNISGKYDIDKKIVRKIAKTYFNLSFSEDCDQQKSFEDAYSNIMRMEKNDDR
jgi:hypothetical protein